MIDGALTIIQQPAEALLVADLRAHLRTDPADDPLLATYITAARRHIERIAGIAFLQQTLEWAFDQFPPVTTENLWGSIYLPRPPLRTVTSVKYIDVNGAQQTFPSSLYVVNTRSVPGRVDLAYGQWWPPQRYIPNGVVVQYTAGYDSPAEVPEELLQALRVFAGALYEQREELVDGAAPNATGLFTRLLGSHRVWVTA